MEPQRASGRLELARWLHSASVHNSIVCRKDLIIIFETCIGNILVTFIKTILHQSANTEIPGMSGT